MYGLITTDGSTVTSCRTQRKREETGQRNCCNALLLNQKKCTVKIVWYYIKTNIEIKIWTTEILSQDWKPHMARIPINDSCQHIFICSKWKNQTLDKVLIASPLIYCWDLYLFAFGSKGDCLGKDCIVPTLLEQIFLDFIRSSRLLGIKLLRAPKVTNTSVLHSN